MLHEWDDVEGARQPRASARSSGSAAALACHRDRVDAVPRRGESDAERYNSLGSRRFADADCHRHDRDLGVDPGAAGEDRAVGDPDSLDAAKAALGVDRMAGLV